jgi:nucleoporin NUP82
MQDEDDWSKILIDHPIFSLPESLAEPSGQGKQLLELSSNTLPSFTCDDPEKDSPTPSGRRQTMILKDADLVVAVGKEIRMTSLGESRLKQSTKKSYKVLCFVPMQWTQTYHSEQVLHTPNIDFEIHQLALNPSAKLLAVAGAFQVAVVVLPRSGFMRLVPTVVDCKYANMFLLIMSAHTDSVVGPSK